MELNNFIDGLKILQSYYDKPNDYHIGAEFYVYPTDKALEEKDIERLIELGWFQEEHDGDEFQKEHYDVENSWVAFT